MDLDLHSGADGALDDYAGQLRNRAIELARSRRLRLGDDGAALREHVRDLVGAEAPALSADLRDDLVQRVVTASVGFGQLEPLLADPGVDEIMVNGCDSVWVERCGALERADVSFESLVELENLIERMIAPLGRRVDEASPICDARLPDGSRVNVVIPPLALNGPLLTIRRFRHGRLNRRELVANGTLSDRALGFLGGCVRDRVSMLVSGGTGSGKTTTLNVLSGFIPAGERIVTIEDAAELRLRQGHVARLEARPPNVEGRGEVTIRSLVKTALRMRPDRIVVGEVRGGEALDMLAAMNTGHDGGLTTVHANSPAGALARVETLAMMAGVEVPYAAVRRMTGSAIELVVHQARVRGGGRRVVAIAEVVAAADGYELCELMRLEGGEERWSPAQGGRIGRLLAEARDA
ncbi:MAG: CpaF family protein [Actinobacteria bacterium]|nr:CpaF family protein [Actinomycetota bacterium]